MSETKQPKIELTDLKNVPVQLTEIEKQFIHDTIVRKNRIVQTIEVQFAEELQHFAAMTAKKKNIQFNEALFAGINFDLEHDKFDILQFKDEKQRDEAQKPQQ